MDTPQQLPVEAARKQFAELLNGSQFRGEHTEITRHGKAAGYLVPPDWYQRAIKALPPQGHADIAAMIAEHRDIVSPLSNQQAAELASRAFTKADPEEFKALTAASANSNHAVVEAAIERGLLTELDLREI